MAISVIPVSSDSSEESVGTPARRVILFGTIPTTIPDTTPTVTPPATHIDTTLIPTEIPTISPIIPSSPDYTPASPDYTPASPNYSPASDMEFDPSEDPSSNHIPPLPTTSPFLSSTDDSSDTSGVLRRRVMIHALGQPIPYGRPYRYHPNGLVHMMTTRTATTERPSHSSCDNRGLSRYVRLHNQSIERDRLIGIGFVLDFVEFISFTFGDKEMILVIEAVSR
ncbi:hypothetical protein Tco_1122833 [Tanacetum coccineum]|uniref:Uncharacterized protein n=1 Tax=Tanacetum coccineum TaxID=301880 RepID=A0ABQ5J468_9ASTR